VKIVEIDHKEGKIIIHIDTFDDLYALYSFIRVGDLVTAKTTRRLKLREGESSRKTMILTIEVEKVSFQEFAERLRITGIIREGPERFVSIGSYHTINVNVGDTITIVRPSGLSEEELEPLKDAVSLSEHKPIILVAIEEGEATVGILTSYGLKVYATVRKNVYAKDTPKEYDSLLKSFFADLISVINELISQYDPIAIIIGGPGFTKEHFQEYLGDRLNKEIPIIVDNVTSGTVAGLYELIRRGTPSKAIEEQRVAKEAMLIEDLIAHLSKKDNLAVYGLKETEEAVNYGLVKILLISMDLIRTSDIETRERIFNMIKTAKAYRGEIIFISSLHPMGKQFKAFGGIAAILRYPIRKGDIS